MNLLTHQSSNAKLSKNADINDQWETWILYLAPTNIVAGVNLCPAASDGCRKACLYTAGRGQMSNVQAGRIRKTELLRDHPEVFLTILWKELWLIYQRQLRTGKRQAIRLNGTSDIAWEDIRIDGLNVFERYPELQFYDYTKVAKRNFTIPNYALTFSRSEKNSVPASRLASQGQNVAVVFRDSLPASYQGRAVIDGTTHDMRFLDPKNVVVGLLAKGQAKHDTSGFVVNQ